MNGFIGVDVGTGSVRAGLFLHSGMLLEISVKNIEVDNPEPGYYQQSSDEIWQAVCTTVKVVQERRADVRVAGISFCATCSLVAIGLQNEPVSICKTGNPKWNIIMWMDHRAQDEAASINGSGHSVLHYVGGSISLEMQTPKLLWLKRNLRESYEKVTSFFDLSDYLRWKATNCERRSICTLVCKWSYVHEPMKSGWDESYFEEIDLTDCLAKIGGKEVSFPGDAELICSQAANDLRLPPDVAVGFSMIDAHSGVLGMIGTTTDSLEMPNNSNKTISSRLALICGTSNCIMALSKQPFSIRGVWGPYYQVILNSFYLTEGGQSASGMLLDHIVCSHPAYGSLYDEFEDHGVVIAHLESVLYKMAPENLSLAKLTKNIHMWPDFHGNRSPLADPSLRGMITGLSLSTSVEDLAILYLATIQSLGYGMRQVKGALEKDGYLFEEVVVCGGLTKSQLLVQILADILTLPVLLPSVQESVVLGSAISAKAAYISKGMNKMMRNEYDPLVHALEDMSCQSRRILPTRNTSRSVESDLDDAIHKFKPGFYFQIMDID